MLEFAYEKNTAFAFLDMGYLMSIIFSNSPQFPVSFTFL